MKIFTIGFSRRSAKDFFSCLKNANVEKLIDVRRRNTSHLCGFTKKLDLQYFLEDCFNIAYEHIPEFSPPEKLLKDYLERLGNKKYDLDAWNDYVQRFQNEVLSKAILARFEKVTGTYVNVCLLCSEEKADYCHRRLLAEYLSKSLSNIEIIHL